VKDEVHFRHLGSDHTSKASISIVLNQIAVSIDSETEWDILDLRNTVIDIVQDLLATVSFTRGCAYDFVITRVLNRERNIDYVFGIDIPVLFEARKSIDINTKAREIRLKSQGVNGVFLSRCLNDLVSAMRHAGDTAFYCYRAMESLRHHCAAIHGLTSAERSQQWQKFRGVAGCTEEAIREIERAGTPLRHGEITSTTSAERAKLFTTTWSIVDGYINALPIPPERPAL
jgi:hypothetical protein